MSSLTLSLDASIGPVPIATGTHLQGIQLADLGMRYVLAGIVRSFSIGPEEPLAGGAITFMLSRALQLAEGRHLHPNSVN